MGYGDNKIHKRIEEVLVPPSMAARVLLINSHIVSLMMYKAQLAPLTREVMQEGTRALQRTTKAPWQSIPTAYLNNAKLFGMPVEAQDFEVRARAAAIRVVTRSESVCNN